MKLGAEVTEERVHIQRSVEFMHLRNGENLRDIQGNIQRSIMSVIGIQKET